jgi:hypothetical protein
MIVSERFYVDKGYIVDRLDPDGVKVDVHPELAGEQQDLRDFILWDLLCTLASDLLPSPTRHISIHGKAGLTHEWERLVTTLRTVIFATILPTTEPAAYAGALPAIEVGSEKPGLRQFTSLSLFVRDLELHLHRLYGPLTSKEIAPISKAALAVTCEVLRHSRPELVKEHEDAGDWDFFGCGIDRPDYYPISSGDVACGHAALGRLRGRVREVTQNPSAHSKYTIEFASHFGDLKDVALQVEDGLPF